MIEADLTRLALGPLFFACLLVVVYLRQRKAAPVPPLGILLQEGNEVSGVAHLRGASSLAERQERGNRAPPRSWAARLQRRATVIFGGTSSARLGY